MLSNNCFHTNLISCCFFIQTVIRFLSLMPGASNLAILMFWTRFYRFLKGAAHNIMKRRSRDGLATKGLSYPIYA